MSIEKEKKGEFAGYFVCRVISPLGARAGIIIAVVLGFFLIPTSWQVIGQEVFAEGDPRELTNQMAIIEIIASIVVIAVTLLSFKPMRRIAE